MLPLTGPFETKTAIGCVKFPARLWKRKTKPWFENSLANFHEGISHRKLTYHAFVLYLTRIFFF